MGGADAMTGGSGDGEPGDRPEWHVANDNRRADDGHRAAAAVDGEADGYGDLAHGWDDGDYLMAIARDAVSMSPDLSADLTAIADDIAALVREMTDLVDLLRAPAALGDPQPAG
ncbi:hypothetical protein [Azospirillum sp. ST 5-10]|uniref:hypothetical protein n=1 Tax=unclassified Azospirillum TaxID=2630922 RepID=UPI003F49CC25